MDSLPKDRGSILEQMAAVADGLRARLLLVLERHELTVSELRTVLQLPQSTVSRHLKVLGDLGWVVSRPDGTRHLYRMPEHDADSPMRRLWLLTREQLDGLAAAEQDALRLQSVLANRRSRSRQFFTGTAGRWDTLRDEHFGASFFLSALVGLLDEEWVVADLGCGSGSVAEALARFVKRVIAVDASRPMLEIARERTSHLDNVELRHGDLEALPIEDRSLDAATLILVLHHLPDPGRVVQEVARALRPGGKLLVVDMLPHDRQEYRQEMGHVWMGFSESQIARQLSAAGMRSGLFRALPPIPDSKGPALFTATARAPLNADAPAGSPEIPRSSRRGPRAPRKRRTAVPSKTDHRDS